MASDCADGDPTPSGGAGAQSVAGCKGPGRENAAMPRYRGRGPWPGGQAWARDSSGGSPAGAVDDSICQAILKPKIGLLHAAD